MEIWHKRYLNNTPTLIFGSPCRTVPNRSLEERGNNGNTHRHLGFPLLLLSKLSIVPLILSIIRIIFLEKRTIEVSWSCSNKMVKEYISTWNSASCFNCGLRFKARSNMLPRLPSEKHVCLNQTCIILPPTSIYDQTRGVPYDQLSNLNQQQQWNKQFERVAQSKLITSINKAAHTLTKVLFISQFKVTSGP